VVPSAPQFCVEGALQALGQIPKRLRSLAQMGVFFLELADPGQTLVDRSRFLIRFDHSASSDANDQDGARTPDQVGRQGVTPDVP